MTYRRLFLWCLAGSTLALVALSWMSVKWNYGVILGTIDARYSAGMHEGTVEFYYFCEFHADTRAEADATGFLDHFKLPSPFDPLQGDWSAYPTSDNRIGVYDIVGHFKSNKTFENYGIGTQYNASYRLRFPLLFPWLIFNTGTFALCWWLQRQAAVKMRKLLAVRDSERDAGPQ